MVGDIDTLRNASKEIPYHTSSIEDTTFCESAILPKGKTKIPTFVMSNEKRENVAHLYWKASAGVYVLVSDSLKKGQIVVAKIVESVPGSWTAWIRSEQIGDFHTLNEAKKEVEITLGI